jgi:hypothetical protein
MKELTNEELINQLLEFVSYNSYGVQTFQQSYKDDILSRFAKLEAENKELKYQFDLLCRCIGWTKERCEQSGDSPFDVAQYMKQQITSLTEQVEQLRCCGNCKDFSYIGIEHRNGASVCPSWQKRGRG